jgi:hypothetical protein
MKINTFQVESWLNLYENQAKYELAETNAKPFTIEELNQINSKENLKFIGFCHLSQRKFLILISF